MDARSSESHLNWWVLDLIGRGQEFRIRQLPISRLRRLSALGGHSDVNVYDIKDGQAHLHDRPLVRRLTETVITLLETRFSGAEGVEGSLP
jgi:hypothetical protein